ncbi:MAG: M48 family metalloprotease [Pseudomonadota bacterium]
MATVLPQQATAQRSLSLIRDAEIERTVARLSDPIMRAAGLPSSSVPIYLINDPTLNAAVVGGRTMLLFSGLIATLETPEELQGVIAHEVGHVTGGHLARRQVAVDNLRGPALLGLALGIAAAAAGAGAGGIAAGFGAQNALGRTLLRYNRAEEAAADQAAITYMRRAGIDPSGLRRVISRFRGQEVLSFGNLDPYTQSHPLSTDRMQLIDRAAEEAAKRTWPATPELDYWHARARAKLQGFLDNPRGVLERSRNVPGATLPAAEEIALYRRAVALYRLPDTEGALAAIDRLIAMRPADPYYHELKGQVLFETARPREAVAAYRRADQLADEPLIKAGLGRALLALDTPETSREALAVLEAARRDDPGDAASLRDLAIAYDRAGEQGLATLATAERFALSGRRADAILHAERASALLDRGSPAWLRAQDILAMKRP